MALEALPKASGDAGLGTALISLGGMRAPIDRFFDEVVVNDDNPVDQVQQAWSVGNGA